MQPFTTSFFGSLMLYHVKQLSAMYFPLREDITSNTAEKAIVFFLEGVFKQKKVIKKKMPLLAVKTLAWIFLSLHLFFPVSFGAVQEIVFCTRIRVVKLGTKRGKCIFIHRLTSFCPFRLEKCSLNIIELMLTSVFLMHSAAEFLFAFLYAHMGKFKSGCLHLTFFFK